MPIVGTAGHVDHGKSTLIASLTGRDPDRWAEEKRRGLTIDLGFAWTQLDDDLDVGFVDVPGHERFIKNMLAGVGGIDAALFVVAADEGWMPQSEEHLTGLDLLDVCHGVVALTRVDLVDDELAELMTLEVEEQLAGTSLEGAKIVPVSAPQGTGLLQLKQALTKAVRAAGDPRDVGRPRLWVDRAFVMSGAGVVVTGTLTDGTLDTGDHVELWPGPQRVRIRSLQSHERSRHSVGPGTRTAINLVGIERGEVARGAMLGGAGEWRGSDRLLVGLRAARRLADPISSRGAFQMHIGSAAVAVRLRLLERKKLAAGDGMAAALVTLARPLPLAMGDRFILREVGRKAVVGGGRVLDPATTQAAASDAERLWRALDTADRADVLLSVRGRSTISELRADTAGAVLTGDDITAGDEAIARDLADELASDLVTHTKRFQSVNPLRAGIPRAELLGHLGEDLASVLLDLAGLVDEGATVRTADFEAGWSADDETAWRAAQARLTADGLAVPRASQLGLGTEVMHALLRDGRLVRVADDLVYLPEQLDQVVERTYAMGDGFTVAAFRDALGLSRRQAVPLLEWLDAQGITDRRGDVRNVRRGSR